MNWQDVEANWPSFLGRIERRWPRTDENDLIEIDGDRSRFATYLSRVHDLTRSEANEEIETWLMGEMPADVKMDEHRDDANISDSAGHIPVGEDVYSEDRDFGDDRLSERPRGRTN